MKRARRRKVSQRNPQAVAPIMRKGGPHQRLDKHAARARQKARLCREFNDGE
jgi:hypothetical protein